MRRRHSRSIIPGLFNMFCSLAANGRRSSGRRDQYGRLLGGPVDGRRNQVVGNGDGRRRRSRRRHGRRHDAIPPCPEAEETCAFHPSPGLRARKAIQAAKVPQRARTGASGVFNSFNAYTGTLLFLIYFKLEEAFIIFVDNDNYFTYLLRSGYDITSVRTNR